MPDLPPSWAFKTYSKLWLKFGYKQFSNEAAQKIIYSNLNQALSRLKRDGWLTIARNPQDSRKSIYSLKSPENTIKEVVSEYAKSS